MKIHPYLSCIGWIVLCEMIGALSSLFAFSAIQTWYAHLAKPFFNPPNWIFAPVWILLYSLMGISIHLILKAVKSKKERIWFLQIFWAQLFLNFFWSILFFRFHLIGAAFLDILFLLGTIILLMIDSMKYSRMAAWLFLPYVLWVSFAVALNFMIWWLNSYASF